MQLVRRGRLPLGDRDGVARGRPVHLTVDGREVTAFAGETVAAVLVAEEGLMTRLTAGGMPRGIYCGMGACFDCLVRVDGTPNTRACMTLVREGMQVERQVGAGAPLRPAATPPPH